MLPLLNVACAPSWYIKPGESIPVYESMERGYGDSRPAGVAIATLVKGDCVAVVGMHDGKDPSAFQVELSDGRRGWVFVLDEGNRVRSWDTAPDCDE